MLDSSQEEYKCSKMNGTTIFSLNYIRHLSNLLIFVIYCMNIFSNMYIYFFHLYKIKFLYICLTYTTCYVYFTRNYRTMRKRIKVTYTDSRSGLHSTRESLHLNTAFAVTESLSSNCCLSRCGFKKTKKQEKSRCVPDQSAWLHSIIDTAILTTGFRTAFEHSYAL